VSKSYDANGCLVLLLGLFIGIPLGTLLYTEAAMLNWNWFAVPLGAPHLGFWSTYGVTLVISAFRPSPLGDDSRYKDKEPGEIVFLMVATIVLRFTVVAGLGYAVHTWASS
jgi:hypothetical protein